MFIFIFQHGKLKDVRLVTYRSGAPKGLAYVEYEDEVSENRDVSKLFKTFGFVYLLKWRFLCLSQVRTWISNIICQGLFLL
jgi:hypothetical protein